MPTSGSCPNLLTSASNVQYMESDLDISFQGLVFLIPVLYSSWAPPNQIFQFQEHLHAGKIILTFSQMWKKTQYRMVCPQAQESAVTIPRNYKDPPGWADCINRVIRVVKQTDTMLIVPVRAIRGLAQLLWLNSASDRINRVWLLNNLVDLDSYWTVY